MPEGRLQSAADFSRGYRDTVGSIRAIADALPDAGWSRPTGCPGWSARDVVAHINALESFLLGDDLPAHTLPEGLAHVRSAAGMFTEIGVDYRRTWPIDRLLEEFRDVTASRIEALDAVTDAQLDGETRSFFGTSKMRSLLGIRIFDIWSHEQDLRRAVGRPGGFSGAAARHARERLVTGVAHHVRERQLLEDGAVLRFEVTGESAAVRSALFSDGSVHIIDGDGGMAVVTLRLDLNTLTVLGCGRSDDPGARERVEVDGDQDLAARILDEAAFTP